MADIQDRNGSEPVVSDEKLAQWESHHLDGYLGLEWRFRGPPSDEDGEGEGWLTVLRRITLLGIAMASIWILYRLSANAIEQGDRLGIYGLLATIAGIVAALTLGLTALIIHFKTNGKSSKKRKGNVPA